MTDFQQYMKALAHGFLTGQQDKYGYVSLNWLHTYVEPEVAVRLTVENDAAKLGGKYGDRALWAQSVVAVDGLGRAHSRPVGVSFSWSDGVADLLGIPIPDEFHVVFDGDRRAEADAVRQSSDFKDWLEIGWAAPEDIATRKKTEAAWDRARKAAAEYVSGRVYDLNSGMADMNRLVSDDSLTRIEQLAYTKSIVQKMTAMLEVTDVA